MNAEISIRMVELEKDVGLVERDLVVILVACRRNCWTAKEASNYCRSGQNIVVHVAVSCLTLSYRMRRWNVNQSVAATATTVGDL
jgi:hypothetical protein